MFTRQEPRPLSAGRLARMDDQSVGWKGCYTHLVLWYVPDAQLLVQRAREKELVVCRVELDGRDKVWMLEHPQALVHADVPQPHRLVHAGGEKEERGGPAEIQHVRLRGAS